MKIRNIDKVNKVKADMEGAEGVYKQVPISKNDGSPNFSFRVMNIMPGGHTPFHQHDFEHLNYAIEGSGTIVEESGREHEFNKGDFALILPNEKHQYKNNSNVNCLVMICAVPIEYE